MPKKLQIPVRAYYNEYDPQAAAWLRELIKQGHLPEGDVDERSILDVTPEEIESYTQCHFFAGIGGWPLALRLAGWPDDRPVWTGSPPCQPFSTAGKQLAHDDERHLAPHFIELVSGGRPPILFGEQVASAPVVGKVGRGRGKEDGGPPAWAWLDELSDRLEAAHYACGATVATAAGIGAPHIRQRLFFGACDLRLAAGGVVDGFLPGLEGHAGDGDDGDRPGRQDADAPGSTAEASGVGGLADAEGRNVPRVLQEPGREPRAGSERRSAGRCHGTGGLADNERDQEYQEQPRPEEAERRRRANLLGGCNPLGGLADAERWPAERHGHAVAGASSCDQSGKEEWQRFRADIGDGGNLGRPCPSHGGWEAADWLLCRDGKWRPVESGTFPLADGVPARVGRLRGYGNAIVPQLAAEFIQAFVEAMTEVRA